MPPPNVEEILEVGVGFLGGNDEWFATMRSKAMISPLSFNLISPFPSPSFDTLQINWPPPALISELLVEDLIWLLQSWEEDDAASVDEYIIIRHYTL